MARRALWLTCVGLSLTAPAFAGDEAPGDWLLKVSEAARTVNYQGVVIYRGDDMLDTFRVAHRYDNGDERERMQSLSGEVREVLKNDDKVICILPKDQKMTVNLPTPKGFLPGLTADRIQQISTLYEFKDLGESRVAGRVCRGIVIAPRDEFRYGYEVWADKETAVPLKVSLLGRDRHALEQMFFTEVEFPATIPDSAFVTAFDPQTMRQVTQSAAPAISAAAAEVAAEPDHPEAAAAAAAPSREPEFSNLPPGFRVTMRDSRILPDHRGAVEHVMISDGLTAVSIFRSQIVVPEERPFRGVSQMGAVHAYGRVVGRVHITVVGEAPQETVRMIGDSFRVQEADPAMNTAAPSPVAPPAAPAPSPAPH
jgi:sigma-E factor negative regulatory protein RseB